MPISRDDLREILHDGEWMSKTELLECCESLVLPQEALTRYHRTHSKYLTGESAILGGREMFLDKQIGVMVERELLEQRGVGSNATLRLPKEQGGGGVEELRYRAVSIRQIQKRMLVDVLEIGGHLRAVRDMLEHGAFGRWVQDETGMTPRSAQLFMASYDCFGKPDSKSEKFSDMATVSQSAVFVLAADSTPESARREAIKITSQGTPLTHKLAVKIIAQHSQQDDLGSTVMAEVVRPAWGIDDCRAELEEVIARWRGLYPGKRKMGQLSRLLSSLVEQVLLSGGLGDSGDKRPKKAGGQKFVNIRVEDK